VPDELESATKTYGRAVLGAAFVGLLVVRFLIVSPFHMADTGMAPAIPYGSHYPVWKYGWSVSPGAVVVYQLEGSHKRIGRIVGLGGDTIEVRDELLLLNGDGVQTGASGTTGFALTDCGVGSAKTQDERIGDHLYTVLLDAKPTPEPGDEDKPIPADHGPVLVPDGEMYILGDNRTYGNDSRQLGTIPTSTIIGGTFSVVYKRNCGPHDPSLFMRPIP